MHAAIMELLIEMCPINSRAFNVVNILLPVAVDAKPRKLVAVTLTVTV